MPPISSTSCKDYTFSKLLWSCETDVGGGYYLIERQHLTANIAVYENASGSLDVTVDITIRWELIAHALLGATVPQAGGIMHVTTRGYRYTTNVLCPTSGAGLFSDYNAAYVTGTHQTIDSTGSVTSQDTLGPGLNSPQSYFVATPSYTGTVQESCYKTSYDFRLDQCQPCLKPEIKDCLSLSAFSLDAEVISGDPGATPTPNSTCWSSDVCFTGVSLGFAIAINKFNAELNLSLDLESCDIPTETWNPCSRTVVRNGDTWKTDLYVSHAITFYQDAGVQKVDIVITIEWTIRKNGILQRNVIRVYEGIGVTITDCTSFNDPITLTQTRVYDSNIGWIYGSYNAIWYTKATYTMPATGALPALNIEEGCGVFSTITIDYT